MSVVEDHDKGGNSISFLELDGFRYPIADPDVLINLPKVKVNENDILMVAYPKSGTHWLWEITNMLLRGKAETIPHWKSELMLELKPDSVLQAFPSSPRVLNTHVWYNQLPVEAREKGCRIIYILRNPKDVIASYYNHHRSLPAFYNNYRGSFEEYLPFCLEGKTDYGLCMDHVRQWEKDIEKYGSRHAIHIVHYEDMKENPVKEVGRLADFLKVEADDCLVKSIAEKCSFSNMKRDKYPYDPRINGRLALYRKGEVGDWKNWFTVQQSEMFDRIFQEKMKGSNFKFRFSI